jgi:hypothetical protein
MRGFFAEFTLNEMTRILRPSATLRTYSYACLPPACGGQAGGLRMTSDGLRMTIDRVRGGDKKGSR